MRFKPAFLLINVCLLIISACTLTTKKEGNFMPGFNLPERSFNSKIVLGNFPGEPIGYKAGDSLAFTITNRSSQVITFSHDFDVKIFKKTSAEWELIINKVEYSEGDRYLPPKAIEPTGLVLSVIPDVGEIRDSTTVRIVIVGQIEEKAEQVGAYIDVKFIP